MKPLFAALSKVGGIVLVVLLILVWLVGDTLGLAKGWRLVIMGAVGAVALAVFLVQRLLAVRGAALIESRLREQAQDQVQSTRPDKRPEVQAVEQQLNEALQALKASRLGSGALYKLPWYMIIGPPGSGKSTALQESGLNFPHVSQGRRGVRGVGGTRNCDWWFTDEGILLDTAGRYTTELDDRAEWLAFLELLKKARKHTPINGALVAVSVTDLLAASDEELERHAKTIRDRLDELTKQLEIVFPVYLLFTKLDLLQGFVEFFEDFTRTDRAQVWGCSFKYDGPPGRAWRDVFEDECRGLVEQLRARRLQALAAERPSAKKQAVYLFPLQFQAAVRKLGDFVGALFRPNPFQESAVFRGFYFTSGTQEGAPIDQVIRSMSQAFGLPVESEPAPSAAADKKSYFLNHLFTKVIFPDQKLARTSAAVARRQKILKLATVAGSAVLTVVIVLGMAVSYFGNRALLGRAEAAAAAVAASDAAALPARLEALDGLRKVVEEIDLHAREGRPLGLRWGLYRGTTVNEPLRKAYFQRLRTAFVGPAAERLHRDLQALRTRENKTAEDYEALSAILQVYQILAGELPGGAPAERQLVEQTLARDGRWTGPLGASPSEADRRRAEEQLRFFATQLDRPQEWKTPLDRVLVERLNEEVGQVLWVMQSYRDIINTGRGSFGKVAGDALVKGKGRGYLKFNYEFSELFTQQGWTDYFKSAIQAKADSLARRYEQLKIQNMPAEKIEARLREYYAEQYAREWRTLLEGVELAEFPDLHEGAQRIKALGAPESPLKELVTNVWNRQVLKLSELDVRNKPTGDLAWLEEALKALDGFAEELFVFVRGAAPGARVLPTWRTNKLQPLLASFNAALKGIDAAVKSADPDHRPSVQKVLRLAPEHARKALSEETAQEINKEWVENVQKPFADRVQGRFPFGDAAGESAPMAAFSRLFNPKNGAFWRVHEVVASLEALNIDARPLLTTSRDYKAAVKKAEAFRDLLFPKDGEKVSARFFATLKQRQGVQDVKLVVGKSEFSYYVSPDHRGEFVWNEGEEGQAKISILVPVEQEAKWFDKGAALKDDWALLRLLASGKPKLEADEKGILYGWEFQINRFGTPSTFLAEMVLEPGERAPLFRPTFFTEFACPAQVTP